VHLKQTLLTRRVRPVLNTGPGSGELNTVQLRWDRADISYYCNTQAQLQPTLSELLAIEQDDCFSACSNSASVFIDNIYCAVASHSKPLLHVLFPYVAKTFSSFGGPKN